MMMERMMMMEMMMMMMIPFRVSLCKFCTAVYILMIII